MQMFGKTKVTSRNPGFDKLTSVQQREAINELLCERFGAPPGTEIAYRAHGVERRGGVFSADLKAEWGKATLLFNVKFMNKTGDLEFSEGWHLKCDEPVEMYLYRGA
jgi:hypothetical protein